MVSFIQKARVEEEQIRSGKRRILLKCQRDINEAKPGDSWLNIIGNITKCVF